jgi:MoaA/NifB/PqqE/SkfB family radical SAM enzyme
MRRVSGVEFQMVRVALLSNILINGSVMYRNPGKAIKATRLMLSKFRNAVEGQESKKAFYINGRYTWDMFNPGWPSKAFNTFFNTHLREYIPIESKPSILRRILIAITKKCPLSCEHCSEGDTLNDSDQMSLQQYYDYLDRFVEDGAAQLVYSGGEPLNRFADLLKMLERYQKNCDQWIYTSGYQLTLEKAKQLKKAGLNGAAISLDHHIPELHNLFRGNSKSFKWVEDAVKNCKEAGILVALNSCITKAYLESDGVPNLIKLAEEWEVPMVNILEPRAAGNYAQKDVELSDAEKQKLASIIRAYQAKANTNNPLLLYPGLLRDKLPCGGGRSYLLLDYDGTLRPCPFCKTPITNPYEIEDRCVADFPPIGVPKAAPIEI